MRYKKDLQNYVFFLGGGGGIPCRTKGVIIVDVACEQAPSEGGKKHSAIESVIPWAKLVPLTLDYTRLARSKTNREPVRRLREALHDCVTSVMSSFTVSEYCWNNWILQTF